MTKTVDEIARLAGVSVTTVRLVINGQHKKYRISEKTRQKIQGIVDEFGYTINQTARSLKLQKTQTLGLIIPRLTNPFFSELAEEMERGCREAGYQLITVCSDDDEAFEAEVTRNLLNRRVDGLFVTPASEVRQKVIGSKKNKKAVVFIDRDFGTSHYPVVATDNEAGGMAIGKALGEIAAGLTEDLYFLGADINLPTVQARLRGLSAGLNKTGQPLTNRQTIIQGQSVRRDGYTIMQQLCESLGRIPGGIVSVSLPILEGAMEYLRQNYGKIPADMVIGSFDDHSMLEFCQNHVVSMRQDIPALASLSITLMKQLIAGEIPEKRQNIIQPEVTVRKSSLKVEKPPGERILTYRC
ncbi:MAG: LacI family DNA-binding transcriptional regulator [Endozoicomonas sp.]|uniref:LacI family DNA-binding transcriptional regulator n=1 Tax=Endozoicomonas sp. TaxID=1892382 RepID=UPI003D9BEAD3